MERSDGVRVFRGALPACPQCQTTLLFRHFFNPGLDLEVDRCARCGGFWIEAGMLASSCAGTEERDDRVKHYFVRIFNESIASMDVNNPDIRDAANTLVRIFTWISPKPFVPLKPPWWLESRPG